MIGRIRGVAVARWGAAILGLWALAGRGAAEEQQDLETLVTAYLRFETTGRVVAEGVSFQQGLPADDAQQVREALMTWQGARSTALRKTLVARFGGDAQPCFTSFVTRFLEAARASDPDYLAQLCGALAIRPPCADYDALNRELGNRFLPDDVREAGWLLGNLQRWAELRRGGKDVPPLAMWLTRDVAAKAPAASRSATGVSEPSSGAAALRAAEAPVEIVLPEENGEAAPSALSGLRDSWMKKRELAFKESQVASDLMLEQRKEWEEDYAAKRLAKAEVEAEAIKRRCEELASVEKAALEQQANRWQAKVKGIVGSLISGTVGAFTGGVGTQAGEKMTEQVFRKN